MKRIALSFVLTLAACSGAPPSAPPDGGPTCEKPCGTACCGAEEICGATNTCVAKCQPQCAGRECGDDGCGGACGECPATGTWLCSDQGRCESCSPQCGGKACGPDGCGGKCGSCGGGLVCKSGQCVTCAPQCQDRECGDDGCGGLCQPGCGANGTCDFATGKCHCERACAGKECGPDGCGGACGSCGQGSSCGTDGRCAACEPACGGRQCGDDGCGGTCGTCTAPASCDASGKCAGPANYPPSIDSVTLSGPLTEKASVTVSATVSDPDGPGDLSGGILRDPRTGATVKAFTGAVGSYSATLAWSDFSAADLTFGSSGTTVDLEAVFYDRASASAVKTVPVKLACATAGKSGCSGACYDLKTDLENCGACGVKPPTWGVCTNGVPGCAAGSTVCVDRCVDKATDRYNCGTCGNDCEEWSVSLFGEPARYWGKCEAGLCSTVGYSTSPSSCTSFCAAKGLKCKEKMSCRTFYSPNYTSAIYSGCADYKQGYNDCLYDQMTLKCADVPPASVSAQRFSGTCNLTEMSCMCTDT